MTSRCSDLHAQIEAAFLGDSGPGKNNAVSDILAT